MVSHSEPFLMVQTVRKLKFYIASTILYWQSLTPSYVLLVIFSLMEHSTTQQSVTTSARYYIEPQINIITPSLCQDTIISMMASHCVSSYDIFTVGENEYKSRDIVAKTQAWVLNT